MKPRLLLVLLGFASIATPAVAGPPYLTDDPATTDPGHWEVFAFGAVEGRRSSADTDLGIDFNYGLADDVQLTATVPLSFSHEPRAGWSGGAGDLEAGVKYRFLNAEKSGFSAAVFPRIVVPTAAHSPDGKFRFFLPLWVQKDFAGGTSLFGGGGYMINPGSGNRNFWQAAVALSQELGETVSVGAEIALQGAEAVAEPAQTRASIGSVVQLSERCALLLSGGPTWADGVGYHAYFGLGFNF